MKSVLVTLLLALPITTAFADDAPPAKTAPQKDVRFVPVVKDGKPYGLKVYAIKPGSRYASVGFKNGDTLVTVDGKSVNDQSTEPAFREVVVEGTRAGKVELDRAGQRMTLTLEAKK